MKLSLIGKIVWVGTDPDTASPRATILIDEGDDDTDPLSLEIDLGEKEAIEVARNLYGNVRICIETISRPKVVE